MTGSHTLAAAPRHPALAASDDPPSKREVLRPALEPLFERGYAETSARVVAGVHGADRVGDGKQVFYRREG